MTTPPVKPLALVDNKTGHLMLLIDARTLSAELEGGMACHLEEEDGRSTLTIQTRPETTPVGPFTKAEADKLRQATRLTVAAFRDGIVTRAREVSLREKVSV